MSIHKEMGRISLHHFAQHDSANPRRINKKPHTRAECT